MLQYSRIPGQSSIRAEQMKGGGENLGTGMPPVPRAGHGMKEWTHKTVIAVWQLRSFCVRTQKEGRHSMTDTENVFDSFTLLDDDEELDMNQTKEDRIEALDEQFYINGYNLDVDQLVGNELTLTLPMRVLCSDNCKGICNRCGTNLNRGTCDCDNRSLDPRMSVIQDIFKQLKEV